MPYLVRTRLKRQLLGLLRNNPVVAILGPRQCGKSTLAHELTCEKYLDLENPRDLAQLDNAQTVLESLNGVVVIDEVQRRPDLFPLLRYLVDQKSAHKKRKFVILGSASQHLIKQSSESLAGRIAYLEMSGFSLEEVGCSHERRLWLRGSFPRSYLARSDRTSVEWRNNFISTYLERELPQLGISIPATTLRRFWIMLSHYHGQLLNYSELATSFGISDKTVRSYIEILEGTFMVHQLLPWHENLGKRLVKSPKLYLSDSGLFHTLQSISTTSDLLSHPKLGASWEGFALFQFIKTLGIEKKNCFFWATHAGAELDLFWKQGGRNYGAEFKFSDAPKITKSLHTATQDLRLQRVWILYPGDKAYQLDAKVFVTPLQSFLDKP